MTMLSFISGRLSNTMRNLKAYLALSIPFIIVFVLLRVYDFVNVYNYSNSLMSIGDFIKALSLDFMLAMGISGVGLILFLLLSFISFRIAKVLLIAVFFIILMLYIAFIQYFNVALVPLDQVVFIYEFNDIIDIAFGSGQLNAIEIIVFIVATILYLGGSIYLLNKNISRYIAALFSFLIIGIGASTNVYIVSQKQYNNELSFFCNTNKFIYFVKAVTKYSQEDSDVGVGEISKYVEAYRSLDNSGKKYGPQNYPFYYKNDYKSTLDNFFDSLPEGEKPNIVLIMVESLSPTVSGKYSPNYSFTPFIDSLAEHSLYWRNCISTSERTFGVMPALLASLPPGKKGFMDLDRPYPNFFSLPKMLKKNGYSTQMFYGGWPGFTHMDKFINAAGIDSLYWDFPGYEKMPRSATGHTWGYGDNVLFKASESFIESDTSYFSLYLTLSTHSPFDSSEPELYRAYADSVIETLKDEAVQKRAREVNYGIKAYYVLDNELRMFMKKYKERSEYEKTIFIITGDHKGVLFGYKNSIDKYAVPLIIYSPLLKTAQEFGGVVTHNDLFPSLNNLLHNKYGLEVSSFDHSIGQQLDTSVAFHADNILFPMRNSRDMNEYINGKYYLNRELLFVLHDTLGMELIDNDIIKNRMQKELEEYKKVQNNVLNTNTLLSQLDIYLEGEK